MNFSFYLTRLKAQIITGLDKYNVPPHLRCTRWLVGKKLILYAPQTVAGARCPPLAFPCQKTPPLLLLSLFNNNDKLDDAFLKNFVSFFLWAFYLCGGVIFIAIMYKAIYSICQEYSDTIYFLYSTVRETLCLVMVLKQDYIEDISRKLNKYNFLLTHATRDLYKNQRVVVFDYIEEPVRDEAYEI